MSRSHCHRDSSPNKWDQITLTQVRRRGYRRNWEREKARTATTFNQLLPTPWTMTTTDGGRKGMPCRDFLLINSCGKWRDDRDKTPVREHETSPLIAWRKVFSASFRLLELSLGTNFVWSMCVYRTCNGGSQRQAVRTAGTGQRVQSETMETKTQKRTHRDHTLA